MAILFPGAVAWSVRCFVCGTLLGGFCVLQGCQLSTQLLPHFPALTGADLTELYKLPIEELLRVRVIDGSLHYSPRMPLIDLELEELLTIKAARLTYNEGSAGVIAGPLGTRLTVPGLKG